MKIIYKLTLFFAVMLSVSACKLQQDSTSSIPIDNPEDVFTTYSDAERFGTGLLSYFRSTTYGSYATSTEIQGDMFNASIDFGNNGGAIHTMSDAFTPSDDFVTGIWNGYYGAIQGYNYYLENIHFVLDTKLSSGQRAAVNAWKGDAFFFRAYSYFELAKKYCDIYDPSAAVDALGLPIVTKFDVNGKPARASLQATFEFILEDIDSAQKYLVKVPGALRANVPTVDALTALRARVALWMRDYQAASDYASALIDGGKYTLASTAQEMKREWVEELGTETIFQPFSSLTEAPRSMGIYMSFYGQIQIDAQGTLAYAYAPTFFPTQRLFGLFAQSDIRRAIYFENQLVVAGPSALYAIFFAKYRGNPALSSGSYMASLVQAKVFRIAEMYLIKAEAEVLGGIGDAKATLNALQLKRGINATDGALADVKTEWARETAGEGVRIECLKRWGDGFDKRPPINASVVIGGARYTQITIEPGSYYFTWPIPTSEMTYNENMVQNPKWISL